MGVGKHLKKALFANDSEQEGLDQQENEEGFGILEETESGADRLVERGGTDIARAIAPSSVIFHEDYFKLNELYQRVIYLEGWPNEVDPNWLREIYQWNRAIDVSVYYQPLPSKSLLQKLRQKSARETAEIEKDEQEGNVVDFSRIQRLEDALELQNMLQRGETKPFQVALQIVIRAESLRELNDITVSIEKTIDGIQARTRRADLRQKDAFLSTLPLGRNYIADAYSTRNMHTQGAQYTFPFANADLSHPSGIWYGINRSTNSNVILDRFRLPSAHGVVLGASGSGKSYGVKLETLRALMLGMPVMVIDPEAEFERLCNQVGGQFITIGPSSPDRINVLDFSYIADGVEDQLTPKVLSVCKLIGAMMNPSGESFGMNAEQFEILQALLREVYQDFGYTQDPRTQSLPEEGGYTTRERMPVLSDLKARLSRFITENEHQAHLVNLVQEIVSAMGPYCAGGPLASLFDQRTTVDLREQFVVFNIRPLTAARDQHLLSLGMHTVLEFVWNTTMNRRQMLANIRRFLFVDEAHIMMSSPESAQFLEDLYRRARKCNVGVTVLTQSPEDFLRPDRPQGKIVFDQSSMQIILRMKRRSLEVVQDLLGLDDTEVDLLSNRDVGEGMLFAMNDRVWITMDTASPEEHDVITTNPDEVAAIEQHRLALLEENQQEQELQLEQQTQALPAPDTIREQPRVATIGTPDPMSQIGTPPERGVNPVAREGPPRPLNGDTKDPRLNPPPNDPALEDENQDRIRKRFDQ